ncbi:hypothetical protein BLA29_003422, partial [Euroglyphus maynei]
MTTLSSLPLSKAKTTTLLHMKLPDNNDDDDNHREIRRRLIIRQSQQQRPHSTLKPKLTTTTNLGRSLYELRDPFTFQQDNESDDPISDQQQSSCFDVVKKMDSMFDLIENSFLKTMERIDNLERKMLTMETSITTNVIELIEKRYLLLSLLFVMFVIFSCKNSQSVNHHGHHPESETINNSNYPSILNKMYSIHQQTYQVCKDAVVLPKDTMPNCPTMTAVCSMIRQYQHDKGSSMDRSDVVSNGSSSRNKQDLIISVGNVGAKNHRDHRSSSSSPSSQKRQFDRNHETDDDLDAEAMREVFGLFANWTLDQYVQRMHRNVAEELNVFSFQIKEKFQHLSEKFTKMDLLFKASDQLSLSMQDIRDQLYENHQTMNKVSDQLQSPISQQCPAISDNDGDENLKNTTTTVQIKALLEEYLEKFLGHLNNSLPMIEVKQSSKRQTSPGVSKPTDESNSTVKFVIYDTGTSSLQKTNTVPPPSYKSISIKDQSFTGPVFEPQTRSRLQKSKCSREANILYPNSCDQLRRHGATCNGVYVILTAGSSMKHVYCDMGHNDGGWTVILRRGKFSSSKYLLNFNQNFNHYRAGFGD